MREFYKKEYDAVDIRASMLAAISVKVLEPVFESQTKTKLGSQNMGPDLPTIRQYVGDFVATLYHALGYDGDTEVVDPFGRRHRIVAGRPVLGLF